MSLADKQAAVAAAELRCEGQRQHVQDARDRLASEFRRSATPLRIVVSGLALGFASGLRRTGTGPISSLGGQLVGPLTSLLMESVLPGLMAGVTAAAVAEEETGPAVAAAVEDVATEVATDVATEVAADTAASEQAVAPPRPRPRRRRKPRADA